MEKSTIKPGLLVSLKSTLEGNVSYVKTELEKEHLNDDGTAQAQWETLKTIENAKEHEEAVKVRGRCRSLISGVCSRSNFGLLCPLSKQDQLGAAVSEAKRLADAFNANAEITKIGVYVLIGELVANEVEAARAINYEVRGLITSMEEGIKKLDVDQVREAANRARNLGAMLSDDANEKLKEAINVARKVARAIVKEGEVAVGALDAVTMAKLAECRTAFLDLDDSAVVETPVAEVEAPKVDLDDDGLPPIVTMDDLEARRVAEEEYAEEISVVKQIGVDNAARSAAQIDLD